MNFAKWLFKVAYVVLAIAVVFALLTGLHLSPFQEFFWRLETFDYMGIDQDIGFMRDLGRRCSYVAAGFSKAVKEGMFSWWWVFFRWLLGNITACAFGLVIVHVMTFLPDMAFKRFKFGNTVLAVPFLSGVLVSAASGFDVSLQTDRILFVVAVVLLAGNVIHFVAKNIDCDGPALFGVVVLLIPISTIVAVLGAVFSVLLISAILPMFLVFICSAGGSESRSGGSGGGTSSSSGGSYSGYSSSYSNGSSYSSGYSDYSSGSSDSGHSSYSSYSSGGDGGGGNNLGGYSSPDVGGGYYNSSYGYSSPDVGGSGYYNMNYGYTGKDVGGGYYNMTYGYSSPDVGGGYYNMQYGYSSDDSNGGSYNG